MGNPAHHSDSAADILLSLPADSREKFKDPLGELYPDTNTFLEHVEGPILAVGDIIAASLLECGWSPAVAVVDGRSHREPIDPATRETLADLSAHNRVENPSGTITRSLVEALLDAIEAPLPAKVVVDGEEDLAVMAAVLAAPDGWVVAYGQPHEGVVSITVDETARDRIDDMLEYLEGDREAFRSLLSRS